MREFTTLANEAVEGKGRQEKARAAMLSADADDETFHVQADGFPGPEKGFHDAEPHSGNNSDRIDALLRREAALKAAIAAREGPAAETEREDGRPNLRHRRRSADALCRAVAGFPADAPKQVLQSAELRDAERAFLAANGWL